jgi:hypothetical protein
VPDETCDCLIRKKTFNKNGDYLVSEVIEFLERLGSDARLRYANHDEVAHALAEAGIQDPARATILRGDRPTLESLLDAKPNVFCGVVVPEEEREDEKDDDEKEDDGKEDEGEDDKEPE